MKHLSSNSVSTNASGVETARRTYYAYGKERPGGTGTLPTDRTYTGQEQDTTGPKLPGRSIVGDGVGSSFREAGEAIRPLTPARKLMPTTCPNNGSSGQFRTAVNPLPTDRTLHSSQKYCAYGGQRIATLFGEQCDPTAVNPLPTDRTYTGQEQDGTGLMYYRARYYDSALGTFISPDTVVPQPGVVADYNRFAYVRSNPLKYTDPTGYYSNDEIMQNFGCSDWSCVEAIFGDGGQHAGLWGWLYMLQMAEDEWLVESTIHVRDGVMTLYGSFQRDAQGRINILAQGLLSPGSHGQFNQLMSEAGFASYNQSDAMGYYVARSPNGQIFATLTSSKHNYLYVDPGMLLVTAMKAGTGFGPVMMEAAPATGPAAPFVLAAGVTWTAVGWGTVAIADFIVPISKGDWSTPAIGVGVVTGSQLLDRAGGHVGKRTSPFVGPVIDVVQGACYGTGCSR